MYHILRNEMKLQAESPKNSPPLCRAGEVWKFKKKFLRSRYTQYLLINTKSGSINDVYKNFHNFVAIEQKSPLPLSNLIWTKYYLKCNLGAKGVSKKIFLFSNFVLLYCEWYGKIFTHTKNQLKMLTKKYSPWRLKFYSTIIVL